MSTVFSVFFDDVQLYLNRGNIGSLEVKMGNFDSKIVVNDQTVKSTFPRPRIKFSMQWQSQTKNNEG